MGCRHARLASVCDQALWIEGIARSNAASKLMDAAKSASLGAHVICSHQRVHLEEILALTANHGNHAMSIQQGVCGMQWHFIGSVCLMIWTSALSPKPCALCPCAGTARLHVDNKMRALLADLEQESEAVAAKSEKKVV